MHTLVLLNCENKNKNQLHIEDCCQCRAHFLDTTTHSAHVNIYGHVNQYWLCQQSPIYSICAHPLSSCKEQYWDRLMYSGQQALTFQYHSKRNRLLGKRSRLPLFTHKIKFSSHWLRDKAGHRLNSGLVCCATQAPCKRP